MNDQNQIFWETQQKNIYGNIMVTVRNISFLVSRFRLSQLIKKREIYLRFSHCFGSMIVFEIVLNAPFNFPNWIYKNVENVQSNNTRLVPLYYDYPFSVERIRDSLVSINFELLLICWTIHRIRITKQNSRHTSQQPLIKLDFGVC